MFTVTLLDFYHPVRNIQVHRKSICRLPSAMLVHPTHGVDLLGSIFTPSCQKKTVQSPKGNSPTCV